MADTDEVPAREPKVLAQLPDSTFAGDWVALGLLAAIIGVVLGWLGLRQRRRQKR